MTSLVNEKSAHTCVESFNIRLESFKDALQAEHSIAHVEQLLLSRLERPLRLLRWAIVRVENLSPGNQQAYWCEGAYLKSV